MLSSPEVTDLLKLAIREDLAKGDITSELTIPEDQQCSAEITAKEDLVICGLPLLAPVIKEAGYPISLNLLKEEGSALKKGEIPAHFTGSTRHVLAVERLCLNMLQHLSGIATATAQIVRNAQGLRILDTRKTTPGLRILEKYAVKVGGGENHRMHLGDMILIKNNHIDAHGDLASLMRNVMENRPRGIKVEVEVRNLEELKVVAPFDPEIIMLDNMNNSEIAAAVSFLRERSSRAVIEASGNITQGRLPELAKLGVDAVSMGMLTNRAPSVDISCKVRVKR